MMLATYRMEKQFALLLAGVMSVVAVWPLFGGGAFSWLWLMVALLPLLLAWRVPQWLTPLTRAWLWLGHRLGAVNSRIILALVFFLVITPVALLFRLFGRDALRLKRVQESSYWLTQDKQWPPESFKDQF